MANPELTQQPSNFDTAAKTLAHTFSYRSPKRRSATRKLALGLGWFSIGLGLLELLAARHVTRFVGLQGREPWLLACGLRELATGTGLLLAREPRSTAAWVRARIAGDAMDLALLATAVRSPQPSHAHPIVGLAAVAGLTVLDIACTRTLELEAQAVQQTTDYRDRSGMPGSPDEMRGAALQTFKQPMDMRASLAPAHLPS